MSVLLLWIGLAIVAASIGSIVLVSGLALWVGSATVIEQAVDDQAETDCSIPLSRLGECEMDSVGEQFSFSQSAR